MGLISYIKGVYYDHRIEKADELLHNGKECEAEETKVSHPLKH